MKQLNSKKTPFPQFDKILVIQPIGEVYGEGNSARRLTHAMAPGFMFMLFSRFSSVRVHMPFLGFHVQRLDHNSALLNPLPTKKFLDSSKLKEFVDDIFKFDENDRKFYKWAQTLSEKEKVLVTSNFSFSQCFQRTRTAYTYKPGLVWEGVKDTAE